MEAGRIPPPPPPPVPVTNSNHHGTGTNSSVSVRVSLFIIVAILVLAITSILCIHRLSRFFFRHLHGSFTIGNASTTSAPGLSGHEKSNLIDSLPLFTLASSTSMAKLPSLSRDCAVCCDPFLPDVELRLLPACRHAFHKSCVDKWLKSNPSCPLCRSSITLPHSPLPDLSSGSFPLELGNVSHRRSEPLDNQIRPVTTHTDRRTDSLDSHDYLIEEQVEVEIVSVPPNPPVATAKPERREIEIVRPQPLPPPPLPPPIECRIREEPVRGWLQEYLDRLSTSASSSFNSMRFPSQRWSGRWSQRSSQRFDSGGGGGAPPDAWLWDLEAEAEAGGLVAAYRWMTGL